MGPLAIALAALLWSTEAMFRFPASQKIGSVWLVLFEHVIALLLLIPWAFFTPLPLNRLRLREWLGLFWIGFGASALAMIFFTASFQYLHPSVAILTLKAQPLITTLLSVVFLGERPKAKFWLWGLLALASVLVLNFPDLDFSFLKGEFDFRSKGFALVGGATILWALATVLGRKILTTVPVMVTVFWRYLFGLLGAATVLVLSQSTLQFSMLKDIPTLRNIFYAGAITGLCAMIVYYFGLARTKASVASFLELLLPLGVLALNAVFLDAPLMAAQIFAGCILIFSVTMISASDV